MWWRVLFTVRQHNANVSSVQAPVSPCCAIFRVVFLPLLLSLTNTLKSIRRSIFSFNPQEEPLIGEAAVIVVNDVRHELYPEFLQRTIPYFFTFDKIRRCYKWADIAFIQVHGCFIRNRSQSCENSVESRASLPGMYQR